MTENITWDEAQKKYPIPAAQRIEYERGKAAAHARQELGAVIYRLRSQQGLTQTELARRAGAGQPTIARIENGHGVGTLDLLSRLATALGADLSIHLTLGDSHNVIPAA